MESINVVVLTGNLTRDPELRTTNSGNPVCSLRVAVNERHKDTSTGEWGDRPNFFNVTVWGVQGENCATYLHKGSGVAVHGRLQWREWEDRQNNKRESVEVIAETVRFMGGSDRERHVEPEVPADTTDLGAPVSTGASTDDDIPF